MNNKKGIALIKLIIGLTLLAIGIFLLSRNLSVEAPIKDFISSYNNKDVKKILKCCDIAGMKVFYELTEDNLDDFWKKYQEFKDTDEYDELMEKYEEEVEKIADSNETDDDVQVKMTLEEIKSKKEVSKNLYKVKAKIKFEYEDNNDNETSTSTTISFYVLKNGLSNKIVGISLSDLISSFSF